MKRIVAVCALLGAMALAGVAHAGNIMIENAFAMPASDMSKPGAVMMTITNNGETDSLVSVETSVAGMAQVHNSKEKGGKMRMRRMQAMEVPGGKSVKFVHDGMHIMLMNLNGPLQAGQSIKVTLTFEKAGKMEIDVPVKGS